MYICGVSYREACISALELKFAQQTGVPLVPVMVQSNYSASGWLGILTAGALWTPLFDPAAFEEGVELLVRQIHKAVGDSAHEEEEEQQPFSIEDVKGELERMRAADSVPASGHGASAASAAGARLPAVVPGLPLGLRVTTEMKQLLSYLVNSDATRVGFCGMGGIGKTVVSSWIVRQPTVRKAFDKIAWVALGQVIHAY